MMGRCGLSFPLASTTGAWWMFLWEQIRGFVTRSAVSDSAIVTWITMILARSQDKGLRYVMETSASTLPTRVLSSHTKWLAWIFAAVCIAAAVLLPVVDAANSQLAGSLLLVAGAVLVAAGLFAFGRTAMWLAFGLVTLGALVGGVALIWLFIPLLAGLVLIVFFARDAFRSQAV
jgi:hypothetical protein